MPGLKDVVKGGWRPEKESWRGDFKGINQMVRCPDAIIWTAFGDRVHVV